MNKIKSMLTAAALVAAGGGTILAVAGPATAQGSAPPWAPGGVSQDQNAIGGLAFFNSAGNQITSGPIGTAPFAAYAVGLAQTEPPIVDTKATLFAYVPQVGQTPDVWSTDTQIGLSTAFPVASAPAPINATSLPVNTGNASDKSLSTVASQLPNSSTTAGYQNVYEIRLYPSSSDGLSLGYDYADITVNTTTNTWALVFTPDQAGTSTTSTLASSATAVNQGDTVTLTDTIAPSAASGTVQFKNGSTDIGSPVAVSGGVASTTAAITTAGANTITAVYTPTALSGFSGSTSNSVVINATHVIPTTTVALAANPTTGPAFTPVTLTATVSPMADGTVKFFDSGAQIGVAATSGGVATLVYSGFAEGDHPAITASFTPNDPTNSAAATSPAVDFNATAASGPAPDPQSIEADVAPGSLAITTPYTPTHPLNLGTLALDANGSMLSASAPFGDGTLATYGSSGPDGTGSIQIVDTRAGNANWTASALASALTDGGTNSINAQNVGLTNLVASQVAGNAQTPGNIGLTNNAAANPPVAPAAPGSAGLGGSTAHVFADTIAGGDGTIKITGLLTLNAPTSTQAGHYTGTITFTVV
jgi:hypothetical protein